MVDLIQFSRQSTSLPFDLVLDDGSVLTALEIVRRVPDKRLVCKGDWNGKPVFAKLFIGQQAERYAARDAAGVERLLQAHILTPQLLYKGIAQTASGLAWVLIFSAIVDGNNAEEVYEKSILPEKLLLAKKLVEEVAHHHHAGLVQTDLYLKNFLVQGSRIYTLDGDAIKLLPRLFSHRAALGNLAVLLSKFDVLEIQEWLGPLLQVYASIRGWHEPIHAQQMLARITRHRHRTVRAYAERKVFRQCTDVAVSRSWSHFLALSRNGISKELEHLLLNTPDVLIDKPGQQRLKSGNTCTVSLAEINGRKMVVKRYNIKSFWHRMGRFWRSTRAADSWANAHRLRMYGIATAAPVALLENRFGPLRGKAFFLAEYIQAPNVAVVMRDASVSQEQKQSVARALAEFMYKLLLLQIVHGDLKASNIHIDGSQPVLIDLDSLQEYRCRLRFEASHVRDLKRLLRNWQDQPEAERWLVEALQKVYGDHSLLAKALKV